LYNIYSYGRMVFDRIRTPAYAEALRRAVRPESTVLDVGTGTGIFALLACRFGARRVYALETEDVIQVAREIARADGCAERIVFLQGSPERVTLPEKADLMVSDLRGVLPLFRRHLAVIIEARKRHLRPGAVLLPARDTLWATLVEASEFYDRHITSWVRNDFGIAMDSARKAAVSNWRKSPEELGRPLVAPACWATLDYVALESPHVLGEVQEAVAEAGTAHGVVIWFDSELFDDIRFSNSPFVEHPRIYGSAFFPLEQPVALEAGDRVQVALRADLVGEDYVWSWNTTITGGGSPGCVKARFAQSTFHGEFRSPDTLRRGAANFVPRLGEDGEIERFVLTRMDGQTSLEEISRALAEKYPGRFPSWQDALSRVAELSRRYSR
jgi:protein arginine N-methyltransferase 1